MTRNIYLLTGALALAALPIHAQSDDEATAAAYAEAAAPQPTARALVEQARNDFLARTGLQLGAQGNPGNAYIGWGAESISVPLSNPAWGRARVAAFENALINARMEFVRFQFSHLITESTREIFEDDSYGLIEEPAQSEEKTRSKLRSMFAKLLAVGDAKLNQKLVDLGLDPEEFDPPPQVSREDHYTNKLLQSTVTRSYGSLAGLMPLQTFEGRDERGNYMIGVLVVYSPSFRQFASDILEGRGKIKANKAARALAEQLGSNPEVFASQFGVRRFYDERGMPLIASFGQYAVIDRGGSDRALERRRDSALKIARSNADAAIALFVNGNLMLNNETVTGQIIEEFTLKEEKKDGFVSTVENVGFVSKLNEEVQQRAEINISGLSDYTTWTWTHPDADQELVGVIRVWSPDSFKAAQNLKNFKPDLGDEATEDAKPTGPAKVKEGGLPVNVSDF